MANILRGLDSPEHLRSWMEAAGRENMVLRVADVLSMEDHDIELFLDWAEKAKRESLFGSARSRVQGMGVNGYILISRDEICSLPMDDLQIVQQWLEVYKDVRAGKGEPSRTEPCTECGGKGRRCAGSRCQQCMGSGKIIIFLEISDEEIALSRARR